MKEQAANEFNEAVRERAEKIHHALNVNNLKEVLRIVSRVEGKPEMDALEQFFLIKYNYNYKSKFFQKGDFDECMTLSGVLNKRIVLDSE
jgi:hypothetical protein